MLRFGDPEKIAIDVVPNLDHVNGIYLCNFLLHINGKSLGQLEQQSSLGVLINGFEKGLARASLINIKHFEILSDEQILSTLNDDDLDYYLLRLSLGDDFDDFSMMLYYKTAEIIRILWQLSDSPFFDYTSYEKGLIYSAELNLSDVVSCLEATKYWLKQQYIFNL